MNSPLSLLGGPAIRRRPFPTWPVFDQTEEKRLIQSLQSGKWGKLDGAEVEEFEKRFAAMHGASHGIGVVNGTVSLRLALLAAGIGAEDEVIVPPYTFIATATAVIEANAVPVFSDVDLQTFNLDPTAVAAAITSRTRAIIPVHFGGLPAEMNAIMSIARKHGLVVIEDAAHAHGAMYKNKPAGSIGDVGSFSFQSSKNLTCGEGGILITSDDTLAAACRSVHNCGRAEGQPWYAHHFISGNYRLGEFQGAVLNAQLDRLEAQFKTREANARYLVEKLAHLPGLHPQRRDADCTRHAHHLFLMRIDALAFGASRAAILAALTAEGIPVSAGYPLPLYRQPVFLNKAFGPYLPQASARLDYAKADCPNCEILCREQGAWFTQNLLLGSFADMDDIARAFEKIHAQRAQLEQWVRRQPVA